MTAFFPAHREKTLSTLKYRAWKGLPSQLRITVPQTVLFIRLLLRMSPGNHIVIYCLKEKLSLEFSFHYSETCISLLYSVSFGERNPGWLNKTFLSLY